MSKNRYLQINFSDGVIFEFSKTAKEGFEAHTNTKGALSYRKSFNKGIYGHYKGASLRESKFGKEVSVAILDSEGTTNYLSLPLFDQNKRLASFVESFITALPDLKVDYMYRFFPYNMEIEGSAYKRTGISIKYAKNAEEVYDESEYKVNRLTYTYKGKDGVMVQGAIPETTWEEAIDGTRERNTKSKDNYLYKVLLQYAKDETPKKPATNPTPTGQAPAPNTPPQPAAQQPAPAPGAPPQAATQQSAPPQGNAPAPSPTPSPGPPQQQAAPPQNVIPVANQMADDDENLPF